MSVNAQGFVELIVPAQRRYSHEALQDFVHAMLPWLQKTLDKLIPRAAQAQRAEHCLQKITGSLQVDILPVSISLPLVQQDFTVSMQAKRGGYAKVQEARAALGGSELILYAKDTEVRACCLLLQKWLVKKAAPPLQERTLALAHRMGLTVQHIRIGAQRGRWGSCSAEGNINLNGRLLLLPTYLVEHVILHELCHRVHMNHSADFKKLLESVSPQSVQKDKELALAWQALPLWVLIS